MNILAFESSCDETAAAVVRDGRTVLSDAILSQADMHALYGGVVPEIASRKHVEAIAGLTDQALREAGLTRRDIDAVAVTYAPGLIGAVLVGVSFAKSVAYALDVPLIPVHHVRGHIAANYIAHPDLEPPFVCLCVSGGTSLIVDVRGYEEFEYQPQRLMNALNEAAPKVIFSRMTYPLDLELMHSGRKFLNAELWVALPETKLKEKVRTTFWRKVRKKIFQKKVNEYNLEKAEQ